MSVVSVVCCQEEVSETNRSLVQRTPTDYDVSLCVIAKPRQRGGRGPLGAVTAPEERNRSVKCRLTKWSSLRHVQSIERLKRSR